MGSKYCRPTVQAPHICGGYPCFFFAAIDSEAARIFYGLAPSAMQKSCKITRCVYQKLNFGTFYTANGEILLSSTCFFSSPAAVMYAWVRMLLDSPIFSARPEAMTQRWATSKSLYLIEELPELITRMIMMSPPYPLTQAHRPAMCIGLLPAWRVSWGQALWLRQALPRVADTSFRSVRLGLYASGHGCACQMSLAYSAMVRSLENLPEWPTLRIALRAQASGCVYKELTFTWVST